MTFSIMENVLCDNPIMTGVRWFNLPNTTEVLEKFALEFDLDRKNVTILGRSDIVGKPLARMMTDRNSCSADVPYYYLAEDGVIIYEGVTFVCDERNVD